MSVIILRWPAGACGDTIIKLAMDYDSQIVSNFKFTGLTNSGSTNMVVFDKLLQYKPVLREILTLDEPYSLSSLEQALDDLHKNKGTPFLFKSHAYKLEFDRLQRYVVDITIEPKNYPFVAKALMAKNWPNGLPVVQKQGFGKWSVDASYHIYVQKAEKARTLYTKNQIAFDDLFRGFDKLREILNRVGIDINNRAYYDQWRAAQLEYFPSKLYEQYIEDQNYNWQDTQLSLVERYCLRALSGASFMPIET